MEIRTTNEKIWWTDNTNNYPSQTLFNAIKSRMVINEDIKLEQKALDRLEVVVPLTDITYLSVNTGRYVFYYYYNRIINILPEAYLVEFKLDIFATFTLPYFGYLKDNNIKVRLNRHHKLMKQSMIYKDELLDAVPISYNYARTNRAYNVWIDKDNSATIKNRKYTAPILTHLYSINNYSFGDFNGYILPNFYYVFRYKYKSGITVKPAFPPRGGVFQEKYIAIPVLAEKVYPNTANYNHNSSQWKIVDNQKMIKMYISGLPIPSYTINASTTTSDVQVYNDGVCNAADFLDFLSKNSKYANDFVGVYSFPNLLNQRIPKEKVGYLSVSVDTGYSGQENTLAFLFYIELPPEGINIGTFDIGTIDFMDWIQREWEWETQPGLNKSDKLHFLLTHKIDFRINDIPLDINRLYWSRASNSSYFKIGISNSVFNFTAEPFIAGEMEYGNRFDTVITYGQSLPVISDTYQKYIGATQATRDTSLNVAKWNVAMGLIGGTAAGITGGLIAEKTKSKYKNINLGTTLFGAATGTASSILSYVQKEQMIKADLADKKATLQPQLIGGDIRDTIIGSYVNNNWYFLQLGNVISYKELTADTIANLNNVLFWYGNYAPSINTLSYFTVRNDFNFYLFDSEYLQNIFSSTYLTKPSAPMQRDYMDAVFNQLISGLRLHNQTPPKERV